MLSILGPSPRPPQRTLWSRHPYAPFDWLTGSRAHLYLYCRGWWAGRAHEYTGFQMGPTSLTWVCGQNDPDGQASCSLPRCCSSGRKCCFQFRVVKSFSFRSFAFFYKLEGNQSWGTGEGSFFWPLRELRKTTSLLRSKTQEELNAKQARLLRRLVTRSEACVHSDSWRSVGLALILQRF